MNPFAFFGRLLRRFDGQDERQFLPAALEVVQTPASPTGRTLGALIVLFFLIALIWAFVGKVDVLATAPGRLAPAGEVKVIQPLDVGLVRAIHVKDGDHVRAGDLLIELDPTATSADSDRLTRALMQAKLDVARLDALRISNETGRAPVFVAPQGATTLQIEEAKAAMQAQFDQAAAHLGDLAQQIAQKDAEAAEVRSEIAKVSAALPILTEKDRIHHDLTAQGFGTSLSYLDAQQQLSEAKHDLVVQTNKTAEVAAARSALMRQREGARSQFAADVLTDLRKAQEQENEAQQELVKANNKGVQTELRSPITGVVDQLAVHTLYGVVTPAQHLMIVVPDAPDYLVEARLENRDVGFVHAGQPVKVKVEAFTFTRYGLLSGHVVDVSRDVIDDSQRDANTTQGSPTQRQLQPPTYVARIALDRTSMRVDGRDRPLQPGMAVTAEIRTGDRTIMDYLLSPIAKKTQETLHER